MALTKVSRGLLTTSIVDNGNATAITIDSNENVGVGNTSPSSYFSNARNLVVGGTTGANGMTISGSTDTQIFFADGTSGADAYRGIIRYSHADNGFSFWTNATRQLDIDASGNVGIGGTTTTGWASKQLVLDAGASASAAFVMVNDTTGRAGTDGSVITLSGSDMYLIQRESANMIFRTANTERMRLSSAGNLGINNPNPAQILSICNPANPNRNGMEIAIGAGDTSSNTIQNYNRATGAYTPLNIVGSFLTFGSGGGAVERLRIDANGSISIPNQNAINELTFTGTEFTNVLSATTSGFNFGTTGAGYLAFITNNSQRMRIDSAGNVDIGGVGNISPYGIRFVINGTGSGGAGLYFGSGVLLPTNSTPSLSDNTVDLGASNYRFNDAFVTNGVTAGSDGNLKQDIAELTDAEQRVAVAAKGLLRKFRWIDAVETKGDDARIHFGIIAQDLQDAFTAEGLDAGRYAMFMSNTWWETQTEVAAVEATEDTKAVDAYTRTDTYDTAEEAPKGATERTRLGIRYSELLAFIISAT